MKAYPKYRTYEEAGKQPSVLTQKYPSPSFEANEKYYPINELLEPLFSSREESRKFGAANFCGFLGDTIEVEHCVVMPAVAALRRLPYDIPPQAEQDLFKTATDEGYHAEQALKFLTDLRGHFGLSAAREYCAPLFLRRLESQRSREDNPIYRDLITVLNAVVTETRISVELGKFAADISLAKAVREVCKSHADDEAIHASQFKALGEWLWEAFDETTRGAAASFITESTIARNSLDVERIALFFHQATGRSIPESERTVLSLYTSDLLIDHLNVTARPTVILLRDLGIDQYLPFSDAVHCEKERLEIELTAKKAALEPG